MLDELAMYADAEKQNSTGWAVFLGGRPMCICADCRNVQDSGSTWDYLYVISLTHGPVGAPINWQWSAFIVRFGMVCISPIGRYRYGV